MINKEAERLRREERMEAEAEFGEIPLSREEIEETAWDQESFRELKRDHRRERNIINSDEEA